MAGTVRISQLSEVTNLAADGVIIVNTDFNTDTRTITFQNFQKSYGAVKSINGQQPDATYDVNLTPAIIGTYDYDFIDDALANKVDLTEYTSTVADHESRIGGLETTIDTKVATTDFDEFVLLEFTPVKDRSLANSTGLASANVSIAANTTAIATNITNISTNAGNIATNTTNIATNASAIAALEDTVNGTDGISDGVDGNTAAITGLDTRLTVLDEAGTGKVPLLEAASSAHSTSIAANTAKGTSNHQLVNALAGAIETAAASVEATDTLTEAFEKIAAAMQTFYTNNPVA